MGGLGEEFGCGVSGYRGKLIKLSLTGCIYKRVPTGGGPSDAIAIGKFGFFNVHQSISFELGMLHLCLRNPPLFDSLVQAGS